MHIFYLEVLITRTRAHENMGSIIISCYTYLLNNNN